MAQLVLLTMVFGSVLGGLNPPKGVTVPDECVYHRRADTGNHMITSEKMAEKVCVTSGGVLATKDEVQQFVDKYGLEECGVGVCGWVKQGHAFNPGCGKDRTLVTCPDNPKQIGLVGYDVWCFGKLPLHVQEDKIVPSAYVTTTPAPITILERSAPALIKDQAFCQVLGRSCGFKIIPYDMKSAKSLEECFKFCLADKKCKSVDLSHNGFYCNLKSEICVVDEMILDPYNNYFEVLKSAPCPEGSKPITMAKAMKGDVENARNALTHDNKEEFPGTNTKFCPVGRQSFRCASKILGKPKAADLQACKLACMDNKKCLSINWGPKNTCEIFPMACDMNGLQRETGFHHYSKQKADYMC